MAEPVIHSVIFGFGHRMRCGKDEACRTIIRERSGEYNIKQFSFAKALKQEVTKMALGSGGMPNLFSDGLRYPDAGYYRADGAIIQLPSWVQFDPAASMDDPDCPLGKQRTFLQFWGVFRREEDQDYWVKQVANQIAEDKPDIALISDLRFENELRFIQTYGEAIRVDRPSVKSMNAHISEEALANIPDDRWDSVIKNDGSLDKFREDVLFTFDMLLTSHPEATPSISVIIETPLSCPWVVSGNPKGICITSSRGPLSGRR
jgi:hypothetical protein